MGPIGKKKKNEEKFFYFFIFLFYRGDTYVVQTRSDVSSVAHGFGNFTSPGGEVYMGQWNMGKRHGKGMKVWDDGREYIGQWDSNRRTGQVRKKKKKKKKSIFPGIHDVPQRRPLHRRPQPRLPTRLGNSPLCQW
jgi:hypothetical protein